MSDDMKTCRCGALIAFDGTEWLDAMDDGCCADGTDHTPKGE